MAKRIIESMTDGLTGETIEPGRGGTLEFTVGDTTYSIDLTEGNAAEFYAVLGRYMQAGTAVSPAKRSAGGRSGRIQPGPHGRPSPADLQAMRAWAREQGHTVSDRGRVPAVIQEALVGPRVSKSRGTRPVAGRLHSSPKRRWTSMRAIAGDSLSKRPQLQTRGDDYHGGNREREARRHGQ